MKNIIYLILVIITNLSAILCALKCKNKILQIIMECIYCVLIFAIPILGISILLMILGENTEVNIWEVVKYAGCIFGVSCTYFIIVNKTSEKRIENYLLSVSLSLQQYLMDSQRIQKQKKKLIIEILTFILLFIFFFWGIFSLMTLFREVTYTTIWISFLVALCFAYVLFVYGKRDEETIESRKTIIGVFITIVWFLLVYIRMNHYWKDINQIGLEDMFILFFSVVFTIPTIWGWIRTIPTKLICPYKDEVEKQKREIIESYVVLKNECNKGRIQFINDVKEIAYIVKNKWKKAEKKRKIKIVLYTILVIISIVILMIVCIWLARILKEVLPVLKNGIENWYCNLGNEFKNIFNKIILTIFLGSMLIYTIIKIPTIYKTKSNLFEKIKFILGESILVIVLGVMICANWIAK